MSPASTCRNKLDGSLLVSTVGFFCLPCPERMVLRASSSLLDLHSFFSLQKLFCPKEACIVLTCFEDTNALTHSGTYSEFLLECAETPVILSYLLFTVPWTHEYEWSLKWEISGLSNTLAAMTITCKLAGNSRPRMTYPDSSEASRIHTEGASSSPAEREIGPGVS